MKIRVVPGTSSITDIGDLQKLIVQELQVKSRLTSVQLKGLGGTVLDTRMTIQDALNSNILHDGVSLVCIAPETLPFTATNFENAGK